MRIEIIVHSVIAFDFMMFKLKNSLFNLIEHLLDERHFSNFGMHNKIEFDIRSIPPIIV